MNDGLKESWRTRLIAVLDSFPELSRAILFGSRAKGTYRRESDIDLAIEGTDGTPLGIELRLRLVAAVDALDLPVNVDLVDVNDLKNPELLKAIRRDGRLWWAASGVLEGMK